MILTPFNHSFHSFLTDIQLSESETKIAELEAKVAMISDEFERSVARGKKLETDLAEMAEIKKASSI